MDDQDDPTDTVVSATVLTKVFLHAAKHGESSVSGFIAGRVIEKNGAQIAIMEDTFPLTHCHILAPLTKIGFASASNYFKKHHGNQIIGFYFIQRTHDESQKDQLRNVVCDLISDKCSPVYFLTTKDTILEPENTIINLTKKIALGNFQPVKQEKIFFTPSATEVAKKALSSATQVKLIDFDDHNSDISGDPTNRNILQRYISLLEKDQTVIVDKLGSQFKFLSSITDSKIPSSESERVSSLRGRA